MGLFDQMEADRRQAVKPLAARMRPRTLDDVAGQSQLLGKGQLLRRLIDTDRIVSVVFYGPPGVGKTSLAELIARHTNRRFIAVNAAAAGVKELRDLLDAARAEVERGGRPAVLFIDELHHFNKQQQNVLLPDVENGIVSLVAATTANPFFALIAPLLSRSQIFALQPVAAADILPVLRRALSDCEQGLGALELQADDDALDFLADRCEGDVRRALTGLEVAALSLPEGQNRIDLATVEAALGKKAIRYDNLGDEHYDAASAFIKSIRGSDPDAAIYWLARMLEAGEEPRFIARRLVISAAEDIGNADPRGLMIAQAAADAVEFIGMPEGRIPLAQAVTYLALAPKSNAAYLAINAAIDDVKQHRVQPVPPHLRDSHYPGAARLGHGKGYQYPHDHPDGWVDQDYLGIDRQYYQPTNRGYEAQLAARLAELRQRRSPPAG